MGTVHSLFTEKDKKVIEKISSTELVNLTRAEQQIPIKGIYVIVTALDERFEFTKKHLPFIKQEIKKRMVLK